MITTIIIIIIIITAAAAAAAAAAHVVPTAPGTAWGGHLSIRLSDFWVGSSGSRVGSEVVGSTYIVPSCIVQYTVSRYVYLSR